MLRMADGLLPASDRLSPNAYSPLNGMAQTLAAVSRQTQNATREVSLLFMMFTSGRVGNRNDHARQSLQGLPNGKLGRCGPPPLPPAAEAKKRVRRRLTPASSEPVQPP